MLNLSRACEVATVGGREGRRVGEGAWGRGTALRACRFAVQMQPRRLPGETAKAGQEKRACGPRSSRPAVQARLAKVEGWCGQLVLLPAQAGVYS